MSDIDKAIIDETVKQTGIKKEIGELVKISLFRICMIDESKTFRYEELKKFEERLPEIIKLKERAVIAFRPFAEKYNTSLCASMGIPMMESINYSKEEETYNAYHEIFGLSNAKAKKFGLSALYCAIKGAKASIPNPELPYNIVFDRDSPWTYRNEVDHMEEYARYHFNSYIINERKSPNPFEPVISLYEKGIADLFLCKLRKMKSKKRN